MNVVRRLGAASRSRSLTPTNSRRIACSFTLHQFEAKRQKLFEVCSSRALNGAHFCRVTSGSPIASKVMAPE